MGARTEDGTKVTATEEMAEGMRKGLQQYVDAMAELGYIITVETQPQKPFAMGNHKPVAHVRVANSHYRRVG